MTRTDLLARLGDGETFTDPVNGIKLTLIDHGAAYATARIEFTGSACIIGAPSVTPSPQAQTGVAGSSLDYSVVIANNDSAGCAPSSFALSLGVPAGWTGQSSAASLILNPGASAQATLRVTSAADAAPATYGVSVHVQDTSAASKTSSASISYAVKDGTPPTAPSKLAAIVNRRHKQVELSWGASTDNVGVAGYRIVRNGFLLAATAGTTWIDRDWKMGATYTYSVLAYDAAANESAASSVTVTLK